MVENAQSSLELLTLELILYQNLEVITKFVGRGRVHGWLLLNKEVMIRETANGVNEVVSDLFPYAMAVGLLDDDLVPLTTETTADDAVNVASRNEYIQRFEFKPLLDGFTATAGCIAFNASFFYVVVWRENISEALYRLLEIIREFPSERSLFK